MWYTQGENRSLRQDPFSTQCEPITIISDFSDLEISQVSATNYVMITARVASPNAPCTCSGTVSKRMHRHYQRTLRDRPASGRPVLLVMQVRRFFCEESTCRRKFFAER